ncbi:hypothetical protein [Rugamonas sp.]|uniref:hypothetical protein n=1 Tax=Rugamonas sp. TaxID=1926287 RepID=UPI0025F9B2EE|nr:hypothetical protein [Rugamonas sp.]
MSTFISAVHAATLNISLYSMVEIALGLALAAALLRLFRPLLVGLARALVLLLKPKLSKEQRLHRRQMRDALMLSRMLNAMDGAPSHAAELRALAAHA